MSVYEAILDLIGAVPAGYEPLAWVVAAVIFLYLVVSMFSIISALISFVGGK